jgi:hypothetical protein
MPISFRRETSERQARDTTAALALSKQAADAAAKSVETSVAAERARLFFLSASFKRKNDKDPDPKISFQIINLGRTSALVTEIGYECKVTPFSESPAPIPTYDMNKRHPAMFVIGQGAPYSMPSNIACTLNSPITDQNFSDLEARQASILFTGYISFQDIFGARFTKHFGMFNFGKDGGFFGLSAVLSAYNDEVKDQ